VEGWQPVIFLASLDSPNDLFVASPDFILSKTIIDSDGTFSFENIVLPNDPRFYRIYMVKNEFSTVEFNTSENRNFLHLILDNNSDLLIDLSLQDNRLQLIGLEGSVLNNSILQFDTQYNKQKEQFTSDLSKAQADFLNQQHDIYIKSFIDSSLNSMAGLYALYHIEEKETDFLRNSNFYFDFQKQIHNDFPEALYTQKYDELLESLVGFRDLVCEIPGVAPKWKDYLIIVESVLIIFLLGWGYILVSKLKRKRKLIDIESPSKIYSNLTEKEKEILKLMSEGKSNKEIGSQLFVELSTVKTHINSIYKQIKVKDRRGAIEFFNNLNF